MLRLLAACITLPHSRKPLLSPITAWPLPHQRFKVLRITEGIRPTGNKDAEPAVELRSEAKEERTDESQTRGNTLRASDQNTKRRHQSD
jgi:hypothetical protein